LAFSKKMEFPMYMRKGIPSRKTLCRVDRARKYRSRRPGTA
jgi:hypothetical protein